MNASAKHPAQAEDRFFPLLAPAGFNRQLEQLRQKLSAAGTLDVHPNHNGLYAASASQGDDAASGYQNAWLRDNAMVAWSRWVGGDLDSAAKTTRAMTR